MTEEKEVLCITSEFETPILERKVKKLRVASYSRVSTDAEEQLNSFELQKSYYTDLIMRNPDWKLVGTYADEGISGADASKRPGFQNMIRQCKKGKIDLIITKSISRFARNTVDSINYVRLLKSMGIGVIFEKENINTLEENSEVVLTILSSLAQEELNSLSMNVKMGKRMAMKKGRTTYVQIYGYKKGEDGKPEIIPYEAETVKLIYKLYLSGLTEGDISNKLNEEEIPAFGKDKVWKKSKVHSILTNERYCGDVLLQKTFVTDPISKKVKKNNGQLPKYLVKNDHKGIVSREIFDEAKRERLIRSSIQKTSQKTKTEQGKYSGKYALSEILVCGKCLSPYRRAIWTKRDGTKMAVWRCLNRLENGSKYCNESPTLEEENLHRIIVESINEFRSTKTELLPYFVNSLKLEVQNNSSEINITEIEKQIEILKSNVMELIKESISTHTVAANENRLKQMNDEIKSLTDTIERIKSQSSEDFGKIERLNEILENVDTEDVYDDILTRNLINTIKVMDKDKLSIIFKTGDVYEKSFEATIKTQNRSR